MIISQKGQEIRMVLFNLFSYRRYAKPRENGGEKGTVGALAGIFVIFTKVIFQSQVSYRDVRDY